MRAKVFLAACAVVALAWVGFHTGPTSLPSAASSPDKTAVGIPRQRLAYPADNGDPRTLIGDEGLTTDPIRLLRLLGRFGGGASGDHASYQGAYYSTATDYAEPELQAGPKRGRLGSISYAYLLAKICVLGFLGLVTAWVVIFALDCILLRGRRLAGWSALAASFLLASVAVWLCYAGPF